MRALLLFLAGLLTGALGATWAVVAFLLLLATGLDGEDPAWLPPLFLTGLAVAVAGPLAFWLIVPLLTLLMRVRRAWK